MPSIKIFKFTQADFVAAHSLAEALKYYNAFCEGATEFKDAPEIHPAQMPTKLQQEYSAALHAGTELPWHFSTEE